MDDYDDEYDEELDDELDEEDIDKDDYDDNDFDGDDAKERGDVLTDAELEVLGNDDGTFDRVNHMSYQSSFGSSVDLDSLTLEQREAYEMGYNDAAADYDLSDE